MPRALAPPRALDHATHSVDRGHGSNYPTRVSVADCRQHFDRFDRVLVLRREARAGRVGVTRLAQCSADIIDPHRSAMGARPAGQV